MTLTEIRAMSLVELEGRLSISREAQPGCGPASDGPVKKISKRFLERHAAQTVKR